MTQPRRQRWMEPQANLMAMGVQFPKNAMNDFYEDVYLIP